MRVCDALQIAELFANGCLRREDFAKAWEIIKSDCPTIDRIGRVDLFYIIDRLLMELAQNEPSAKEEENKNDRND